MNRSLTVKGLRIKAKSKQTLKDFMSKSQCDTEFLNPCLRYMDPEKRKLIMSAFFV